MLCLYVYSVCVYIYIYYTAPSDVAASSDGIESGLRNGRLRRCRDDGLSAGYKLIAARTRSEAERKRKERAKREPIAVAEREACALL